MMEYRRIFNPKRIQPMMFRDGNESRLADRSGQGGYVYTDEVVLAVNVALATSRPLLVRGPSGTGKSSLARNVASVLKRRYYEKVITSRTQAQDLLWEIDLLRRLQDAQATKLSNDLSRYTYPGVLWWAFNRESAREQLLRAHPKSTPGRDPGEFPNAPHAVVLLDEIDKADPDVPNNLLVPLGSLLFRIEALGLVVRASQAPLVIITTNEERELPAAFLRRCVELRLKAPDRDQLVDIGRAHFEEKHLSVLKGVADLIIELAPRTGSHPPTSSAEYLDSVRACLDLNIQPGSETWNKVSEITVWKHGRRAREKP